MSRTGTQTRNRAGQDDHESFEAESQPAVDKNHHNADPDDLPAAPPFPAHEQLDAGEAGGNMRAVKVRVTVIAGKPRDLQIRIHFDVLRNVRIRRDPVGGKRGHNDAAGKKQGQSRKTDCAGKPLCHAREQQKHHEKEQIVILNGVRADRLCDQRRDREKCRHQDLIQRQAKTVSLPIIQACHKQCNGKKRDAAAVCPQSGLQGRKNSSTHIASF